MQDKTISALHDFALNARRLLENEVGEQLEGIYGFLPAGRLEASGKYPALKKLPDAAETRSRVEQYLADEQAAGIVPKEAREKLVREAAYTWLNRLVAFRMMEDRGLIKSSIAKGMDSNAFKLWLTQKGNEPELKNYEAGDLPQNSLGEGPRQEAYRHFLVWQCGELAKEIRVLFDTDNLISRLFPRPRALNTLLEIMNGGELKEAWASGNEETIGWVYQYFNEPDLDIFRSQSAPKVPTRLLAPKTQQFTPRWIVRYLVENTLGRLWIEMHPDSALAEKLSYLVPSEGGRSIALKHVREIRLLDPACGSMHFGLVAFDIFREMYKEELERAGSPGWPEKSSVAREEDIPASIIAHNIAGIDLDPRAVQLSALALYLRAKAVDPGAMIRESNLACADIHMLHGDTMKRLIAEAGFEQPIFGRILTALGERLKDSEHLGSLLSLEQEIVSLISKERALFESKGRQLTLPGWKEEPWQPELPGIRVVRFEKEAYSSEFWDALATRIERALDLFATEHGDDRFFVGEVRKGVRYLKVVSPGYDIVATNPPYLDSRDYNPKLKTLLEEYYPDSKRNLYACFQLRCTEFLKPGGRLGIITPQTFMFISTFEKTRAHLRDKAAIETLVHTGLNTFPDAVVDCAFYTLRREEDKKKRDDAVGTYFRLVKEPDSDGKRRRFEEAVAKLKAGENDPVVYRYRQGDFDAIAGSPWVYWITPGLRKLFQTLPKLEEIAQPRQGLATADNFRFLRYWWEAGQNYIALGCKDSKEADRSGKKWFPYMKGGSFLRWYGNQEQIVNWWRDGNEIRNLDIETGRVSSRAQNTDYYFRRGVTYSYLTSGTFSARLSPGGFIFDVAGSSLFPENIPLVLAVMNSTFAAYALKLINPTVNFQVGDLARLPIPQTSSPTLESLVEQAIVLARADSAESEVAYDFLSPPSWRTGVDDREVRAGKLAEIEKRIDEEVYRLYGIGKSDRAAIEAELAEKPIEDDEDGDPGDGEVERTPAELSKEDLAREWIAYAIGIILGRFRPGLKDGLGRGNFSVETNRKLQTLADPDALLVMDKGHSDDLTAKVLECLSVMFGAGDAEDVVKAAAGEDGPVEDLLRGYLEKDFFKEHIQLYRKRPVYWLLQSPHKEYGVWVFQEKLNKDTLFRIRTKYVEQKVKLIEGQNADLNARKNSVSGREQRTLEREIDKLSDVLDDIREFAKLIKKITDRGYTPHIDDGVLINMAPLWELIPSWQKEPKEAWRSLESGEWDWSCQAMDHWPDRVKDKCKKNKSYAIAHGLEK